MVTEQDLIELKSFHYKYQAELDDFYSRHNGDLLPDIEEVVNELLLARKRISELKHLVLVLESKTYTQDDHNSV